MELVKKIVLNGGMITKVRLLLGILLAFLFILAGCNKETDTAQHKKEKTKDEKIKIVEEKSYTLADSITHNNVLSYSAVIKNESDQTLNVNDTTIKYVNKTGKVLDPHIIPSDPDVHLAPYVLKPGEEGYISAEGIINKEPDTYNVKVKINPIKPASNVQSLKIKGDAMSQEKENHILHIKGTATNNTKESIEYILVGGALYGKQNEFIGTTFQSEEAQLTPGKSISFDAASSQIPDKELAKVKKYKVVAFTYQE
ncbi:FxLYD domain-containing protein [Priestia megaterium]|uniref:FxLYD domain-containing protein n=1 Tax=Priestia megaterium TaxID=1404 RepID=UPI0030C9F230